MAGHEAETEQSPQCAKPHIRNPRAEATSLLPEGFEGLVLEPSPPANSDPEWYADDPTCPPEAGPVLVTPIPGEGITWADMTERDPRLSGYAAEHWLSGRRGLTPFSPAYTQTRDSLHQVAFFALGPKRHAVTGKLGLRYTFGGFGTPFFGDDRQVRVEGPQLVYQHRERVHCQPLTTLEDACAFLEISYREVWFEGFMDPPAPVGPSAPLIVEQEAAAFLGDWFGFATLVLERLRRMRGASDVSRVQLWPEHFDVAVEIGSAAKGDRASYGASPGDADHSEPHFYVAPWAEVDRHDAFWNDSAFNGASLSYSQLLATPDPIELALEFLMSGRKRLCSRPMT